jgi:hypothetical protein
VRPVKEVPARLLALNNLQLVDRNPYTCHLPDERANMLASVLITHCYGLNELNILIQRSYKSGLFEDPAQQAIGGKEVVETNQEQAGACELSCRSFVALDTPDEGC